MSTMLAGITYVSFSVLAVLAAGVQYLSLRAKHSPISQGNNPIFLAFQKRYLIIYLLAIFADWLHAPYLYKLYSHYGFMEQQITIIYVSGYFTVAAFGTLAGFLLDRISRKKLCIAFTIIYSLASLAKLSRNYFTLIVGRILGGISMSLLPAFDKWYSYEHVERYGFPTEWVAVTFAKANLWNGLLAAVAGVTSNLLAEWFNMGPVAPFILAIPFLALCGALVTANFDDTQSASAAQKQQPPRFGKNCAEGLKTIVQRSDILLVGCIQALMESSQAVFIFVWTPIFDTGAGSRPPLGICFACFMLCTVIGDASYRFLSSRRVPTLHILTGAIFLSLVSILCVAGAVHLAKPKLQFAFFMFLLYEVATGVYFPAMSELRLLVVPESQAGAILNWFRVPLNALACVALVVLHDAQELGNHIIFIICSALLAIASVAVVILRSVIGRSSSALATGGAASTGVIGLPVLDVTDSTT